MIGADEGVFAILVVAKAPEPGRVKTRMCPPLEPNQAADVAAAALLDTLSAATQAVDGDRRRIIAAIDGQLSRACRGSEIVRSLKGCQVIEQRGRDFAERLTHAHLDAKQQLPESPILQIGMDTPQMTSKLLVGAARQLMTDTNDAVLGPASDGGWWLLGLRNADHATVLQSVLMSSPSTGRLTREALQCLGLTVSLVDELTDVDEWSDALAVAQTCVTTRFSEAVRLIAA